MIEHSDMEISVADLASRERGGVLIVDIRDEDEYAEGAIPGAIHIPEERLERTISDYASHDDEIVLYCDGGRRSLTAAHSLAQTGYSRVVSLAEGSNAWRRAGQPWYTPNARANRYARHIALPEIGRQGQQLLLDSKVLIVGAGGLGSPAALYLTAAGVGTVGIVDFDDVALSNLQRQILHTTSRVGMSKVSSAARTLNDLNPDVTVVPYRNALDADNVLDIVRGYDVVLDGTDNFPTRYLLTDASLHLRVPVVYGAALRFEGQVSVFKPYDGPCYRCLFPEPPPPELAPSCAEAGVLGAVTGIMGSIEALEVIKLLLGVGEPLVGRLLVYDALDEDVRVLRVRRDPACPACRDASRPPRLVDYDWHCAPAGTMDRVL
jgi:molybdopterin/thiamine biosynthesis adenylyltransferase/rhodanese-related sulfurtransferase